MFVPNLPMHEELAARSRLPVAARPVAQARLWELVWLIAMGVAAGRKTATDAIRTYVQTNQVTIQRAGSLVSVDDFLSAALEAEAAGKKKAIVITILVLGAVLLLGIVLYRMQ